jgi:hypothetical protein
MARCDWLTVTYYMRYDNLIYQLRTTPVQVTIKTHWAYMMGRRSLIFALINVGRVGALEGLGVSVR